MGDPCAGCGSVAYSSFIKQFVTLDPEIGRELKTTRCSDCEGMLKRSTYTDAAGNAITMTQPQKYSYALGGPITSKRQFSEQLKKMNLVQTGTAKVPGKNIRE